MRFIDLRVTKVTEAGIQKLAAALPQCRIKWDGGVIDPKPLPEVDRVAAEKLGPYAHLTLKLTSGKEVTVNKGELLPDEPFALVRITFPVGGGTLPSTFVEEVFFPAVAPLGSLTHVMGMNGWPAPLALSEEQVVRLVTPDTAKSLITLNAAFELTPRVIDALTRLPKLRNLHCLATDADDAVLERLAELPSLVDLGLGQLGRGGRVSERGLAAIARLPLEYLVLNGSPAADGRFTALIPSMSKLTAAQFQLTPLGDAELADVARCSNLWSIALTGTRVTDAGLSHLAEMPQLRIVALEQTKVTEAGAKQLAAALPLCKIAWDGGTIEPRPLIEVLRPVVAALLKAGATVRVDDGTERGRALKTADELKQDDRIRIISVGGPETPFDYPAVLAALQSFPPEAWSAPERAHFVFFRAPITAEQFRALVRLPGLRPIHGVEFSSVDLPELELSHLSNLPELNAVAITDSPKLTGTGFKVLAALPKVNSIYLSHLEFDPKAFAALNGSSVISLHLTGSSCIDDSALEQIAALPAMRYLDLAQTKVTEAGVKKLVAALPRCNVRWDGPGLTADERKSLEWLLSVGSKLTVSVGGKQVDIVGGGNLPEGAFAVVGFDCQGSQAVDDESVENLRNLPVVASWARLWKTRLTDVGVAKLTAIPALAGINDLSLGDCALTEKGFALLTHFSKLRTLYLDHTPITSEAMAHVGQLSSLTWLRLTGTQVDATSLASLRGMGLKSLYLNSCTRVDDGGMEHLATLAELNNLSLHGTAVTDAGLEKLATMMSLRSLYLGSTKVSSAGVKKLAAALPQCRIEWGGGVIEPRPVADALRASVAVFLKSGAGVAILEGDKPRNITSVDELRDHDRVCTIAIRAPGGRNLLADPAFVAALKAFPADRWSGRHSTLYFNGELTAQQIYDTLQIPYLQEVRTLGIADGLPDGALKYVAQLPKLTSLGLYRNPNVSEAVFKQIAALPGLIRLDLDHSTIDPAGLAALAGARLQSLHIVETASVDDAAIEHLAAMTTLRFVVLKGTKLTEPGVKKLAAALPECRIEWDGGVIEPLSRAEAGGTD